MPERVCTQKFRGAVHYSSGWEASGKSVTREQEQTVLGEHSGNKIRIWKYTAEGGLSLLANQTAARELASSSRGPGLTGKPLRSTQATAN